MNNRIQKKTVALWSEIFSYMVIARSISDIMTLFGLNRQQIWQNLDRMEKYGFTIRRTRVRHQGGGSLRVQLSMPLSQAMEKLTGTKERKRKAYPRKKATRAPTALKNPSGAPWFVLTDNCINIYKREL